MPQKDVYYVFVVAILVHMRDEVRRGLGKAGALPAKQSAYGKRERKKRCTETFQPGRAKTWGRPNTRRSIKAWPLVHNQ